MVMANSNVKLRIAIKLKCHEIVYDALKPSLWICVIKEEAALDTILTLIQGGCSHMEAVIIRVH